MARTTVSKGSNGQYKVTIPKGLGDGLDLEGETVEWEVESGSTLSIRVVDDD